MTTRFQTLRSSTTGNIPAAGTRQPGELWLNFADFALGFIDASKNAQRISAVRYFQTTANYAVGDFAVQGGALYVANQAISAGAFSLLQWSKIATMADITTAVGGNYLPIAGGTMTGALTPSQTAGIVGTTAANNVNAGAVGEYVVSNRTTNLPMTTSTIVNIASISLTAGDWDVQGYVSLVFSTNGSNVTVGISLTSVGFSNPNYDGTAEIALTASNLSTIVLPTGAARLSIASTTTVYLVALGGFSSGTCNGQGTIRARRVR